MGIDIVIPPMPRGDPGGMRELAGACRSTATQLGSLGDDVTSLPRGMVFEGHAATAFTGRMQSFGSQLAAAAAELQDAAGRLESAAAEVERQIVEREKLIRRLEELRAQTLVLP